MNIIIFDQYVLNQMKLKNDLMGFLSGGMTIVVGDVRADK